MLNPLNKLIGGIVGMTISAIAIGVVVILLSDRGIHLHDDVLLAKEIKFLTEKIWSKDVIISWLD